METPSQHARTSFIQEIAKRPATAEAHIALLHLSLETCQELIRDLTWGRGGSLDPLTEEHAVKLLSVIRNILRHE